MKSIKNFILSLLTFINYFAIFMLLSVALQVVNILILQDQKLTGL